MRRKYELQPEGLRGNLGELIYDRSGSMQHSGETQHHLAGGSHASQISQVTKRVEQSNVPVMEQLTLPKRLFFFCLGTSPKGPECPVD